MAGSSGTGSTPTPSQTIPANTAFQISHRANTWWKPRTCSRWSITGTAIDLPDKPKLVYVPAYYPNAPSQQAALPVEVGVGADVRGIDIGWYADYMFGR